MCRLVRALLAAASGALSPDSGINHARFRQAAEALCRLLIAQPSLKDLLQLPEMDLDDPWHDVNVLLHDYIEVKGSLPLRSDHAVRCYATRACTDSSAGNILRSDSQALQHIMSHRLCMCTLPAGCGGR